MNKLFAFPIVVVVVGVIAGGIFWQVFASQTTDFDKIVITGSSTIAPLISRIAKRYEETHPNIRIDVQAGGSSRGLADARTGSCDIGMVSREPASNETELNWIPIATDAVGFIVNDQNNVNGLTDAEIISIYTGQITNWSQVGGVDSPITVINKAEGRATLEVFLKYFKIAARDIQADLIIGHNQQAIKTVVGNPDAICYVSLGTVEYEIKRGTGIKLLDLETFETSTSSKKSGSYPLSRPLNIVTRNNPSGTVLEFLEYCQSAVVHDLVREEYFIEVQ